MSASLITGSAVPSWYLFQLSAVPTLTPGKDDFMSLILATSYGKGDKSQSYLPPY
jgi:hypothetical protein